MTQTRLDERVHKSLQILARKGGDLLRAERDLISSTIKDLAVIANGDVERKALADIAADLRSQGARS